MVQPKDKPLPTFSFGPLRKCEELADIDRHCLSKALSLYMFEWQESFRFYYIFIVDSREQL